MIDKGIYIGSYSFSDDEVTKARGFATTYFQMEILFQDGNTFSGTIRDDLSMGGMEGTGEIKGEIKGNQIRFVKYMPVLTLLYIKPGIRKTFNRKHRPILYSGTISQDGKLISGNWRFKHGILWRGIIPVLMKASRGTWNMKPYK